MLPQSLFGVFSAFSGPQLSGGAHSELRIVIGRIAAAFLWTFLNLFIFVLSNQGSASAAKEDSINKAWRPIPAGRATVASTRRLLFWTIPSVLAVTYFVLGSHEETCILIALTWMYNEMGVMENSYVIRDLLIGVADGFYGGGALRIATGQAYTPTAYVWLSITSCTIFTTMSIQDLKDQRGDLAIGRRTMPIVLGDYATRRIIGTAIVAWSIVCTLFWQVSAFIGAMTVSYGLFVSIKVVTSTSFQTDRTAWKLWANWMILLYALPTMKYHLS